MGTRAQFFIGNPENVGDRSWLGCTAWNGHPDGWIKPLAKATTQEEFVRFVQDVAAKRDDFCDPAKHGFPFPWTDDLFLTDCTYAWFGGKVMLTTFHQGWVEMAKYLSDDTARDAYDEGNEKLPGNVPAPTAEWDRSAPDSIMILGASQIPEGG